MKKRALLLCAALLLGICMCAAAQETDAGMGVFPLVKKSGIKWVDQLMRRLDMPYTLVYGEELEPEKLIDWYCAGHAAGYVPVIVEPTEEMSRHVLRSGGLWDNRKEALKEAEKIYGQRYSAENLRGETELSEEIKNAIGFYGDLLSVYTPQKLCALMLVPAEEIWQLPTYLPTGGMREDIPDNAEQTAVLRHWYNQYGCMPLLWRGDGWDVLFAQPPKAALKQLAFSLELENFCPVYRDSFASVMLKYFMQSDETGIYSLIWPEDGDDLMWWLYDEPEEYIM
ncbi:MAG: DUF4253 domain-containing protein [Clostridia bacterium]|nr:DUF4253 domain-containing protein [Clostridia bacterium]MBQ4085897.1 DUF4253 domain-containing protein [Clostridia bacterium]